jgi:hypothetical protein
VGDAAAGAQNTQAGHRQHSGQRRNKDMRTSAPPFRLTPPMRDPSSCPLPNCPSARPLAVPVLRPLRKATDARGAHRSRAGLPASEGRGEARTKRSTRGVCVFVRPVPVRPHWALPSSGPAGRAEQSRAAAVQRNKQGGQIPSERRHKGHACTNTDRLFASVSASCLPLCSCLLRAVIPRDSPRP